MIYLPVSGIALYTVIRLQKEKVSEHPPWKVVYSETRL